MTITIEEVKDRQQLSRLEPEWRELVGSLPAAEPFGTPEWLTSWLDAFWRDKPIRFLFARANDRLVGLAPLLLDETGTFCCRGALSLPVDVISWRGEILHTEDAGAVIGAMIAYLRNDGLLRLTLPRVATDSPTARALLSLVKSKALSGISREENRTPIIRLPASGEEYLKSRSKHVRHELRRKRKRLEEAGELTVSVVDRPEDLDRAFDDVRAIEATSWKESFLEQPSFERFYRTLFSRTAAEGWARIYVMYLDGKPIAHLFGFVFRRRYYAMQSSYDGSLGSYSPGSVLILRGIEDACSEGLEVFDFMGSEYRWKNEMATEMREHLDMCIFSSFVSKCGVNWIVDQQVKPNIRRHLPVLFDVKRAVQASMAGHRPGDQAADGRGQGD